MSKLLVLYYCPANLLTQVQQTKHVAKLTGYQHTQGFDKIHSKKLLSRFRSVSCAKPILTDDSFKGINTEKDCNRWMLRLFSKNMAAY